VDRTTIADYYRAADLTVVPSYNESFGLVALESQACGTPVVAAAVGGLTTAVRDGLSGVLVDGHDPDLWAKVLQDLVANPAELSRLAANARDQAGKFSWERTTDGLVDVYEEAIVR
jgi:D-inositol-3-phosphate glycosyltransferase